ncbi:MAG: hypothetical protein B7Z10_07665 [Rhodobacterales bacterium 32-66-7]|nr:MAG: hypothetical protein B7Z31_04335 [Rhodobacterales bacterium 12-65-15]OYX24998.1 MAG: hypothetical protein B7Z10_07665 [Rhodobacterales bacterium 32-66-7]
MGFRWIAVLIVALAAGATSASAESFSKIAGLCGADPNAPAYSDAEFTQALVDADRAKKAAKRAKNTTEVGKIDLQVQRIKQCQKEMLSRYDLPPWKDCKKFVKDTKAFETWSAKALKDGHVTKSQVDEIRRDFKVLADLCMEEVTSKCIDPEDTKAVLEAVEAVVAASAYTDVYSYRKLTGAQRFITEHNPWTVNVRFCKDTDYACKGETMECTDRVDRIKKVFQSYIERF